MPVKNCCIITKFSGQRAWTSIAKWMTTIMIRDGPEVSVERRHSTIRYYDWLSAVCGETAPACSTCSTMYRASTQAAVYEYYCNTPKELFIEAILSSQGDGSIVQV